MEERTDGSPARFSRPPDLSNPSGTPSEGGSPSRTEPSPAEKDSESSPSGRLELGMNLSSETPFVLPSEALLKHVAVLGSTGSGKTVLCKVLVEEAVRNGIAVLAVDPQGDVASLAQRGDARQIESNGTPSQLSEEFFTRARVAIFTPASSKGVPLSVNPLRFPTADVEEADAKQALDMTASSLASLIGADPAKPAGKPTRAALYTALEYAYRRGSTPKDLEGLAQLLANPPPELDDALAQLVPSKVPGDVARKLRQLTAGASSLLFEMGLKLDLDTLLDRSDGKVPVNVVYLNSLASEVDKQFFLTAILREVYLWMLKHPSPSVQLLLYIDEIGPYLPPYPRNPPPKLAYSLLFKQGRKYGVSLLAATQTLADVDYKALGQASTVFYGRFGMAQDLRKLTGPFEAADPVRAESLVTSVPALTRGQFLVVSRDNFTGVARLQTRFPVTGLKTLTEEDLGDVVTPEIRARFQPVRGAGAASSSPPSVGTGSSAVAAEALPEAPMVPSATSIPPGESGALSEPSTLRLAISATVEAAREAVGARSVAERTGAPPDAVARELAAMVKAKIVATGRIPGSSEDLYWIVGAGFQPSVGLTRELLSIPMRIAQVDAVRQASSMAARERFARTETVAGARLGLLPIWKITCRWTTKAVFSAPKEHVEDHFVSARTGAFMSIQGKEMHFDKIARQGASKVSSLNDEPGVSFQPTLPRDAGPMPVLKVTLPQAFEILRRTFGIEPTEGRLALLPVWELTLRRKEGPGSRILELDAATGKILKGDF